MSYYKAEDDYNQHSIEYVDNRPLQEQQGQLYRPATMMQPQDIQDSPKNKLPAIKKRTKAESLAIVRTCKRWLIASSIVAFGAFGGLALTHTVGATTHTSTTTSSSSQSSKSTQSSQSGQSSQSSSQSQTNTNSNGSFFQQQQGGNSFGNSNQSQGAVSGSSAS